MRTQKRGIIGGLLLILTGCDFSAHRTFHDPHLKLRREDYDKLTQHPIAQKRTPSFRPPSPPLPREPRLTAAMQKKVTLSLRGETPLAHILMELGHQAGVGIAYTPAAEHNKLIYSAHEIPLIEIIRDLCILTHHRFQIQGNRILIEPDTPYLVTYDVQCLSHIRKNENRVSIATDVFSPLDTKERHDNGSNSVLSGNSQVDFWAELEQNLRLFLGPFKGSPPYSLHKQGGLVTISGTTQQHQQVADYLKKLKESISTQVIIEAKIIEVTLNNAYKTGINWGQLGKHFQAKAPLAFTLPHQGPMDLFTFSLKQENFSAVLNLVKQFGTVRTLSNPRLTVMNNQPAILKVATNEVFFHLEFERLLQAEGKPDIETISSDPMTVPIGLVLVVQPAVNLKTGDITMTLRPTISRVQKEVEDPAVSIKSQQQVKSTVPVVQVRELDSVLTIKSGQVVILGGLMEERASNSTAAIPLIDALPLFGELAKGKEDERQVTELVIFLTAHIAESPHIPEADERLYNVYTQDPRPLNF